MRPYLIRIFLAIVLLAAVWYVVPYPTEVWIRYNVWLRSQSLDEFAAYVESQSDFEEATCRSGTVELGLRRAPPEIEETVLRFCTDSRLRWAERTSYGSRFYLGVVTKLPASYNAALIHSDEPHDEPLCERFSYLDPGHSCVFELKNDWKIHYINLDLSGSDAQSLAEDVARESEQSGN